MFVCFQRVLILSITMLALAACRGSGEREQASASGVPAGTESATHYVAPSGDTFQVAELEGFVRYGRPSVRISFPRALATGQNFDGLIDLRGDDDARPNGSWMLEDDNRNLVFPYLEANTRYRLSIKGELAAADGTTLGQPFEHTVYSGPLLPMLGFASQGNILPARDSAGLPVITVNVTDADIEFLRVRPRALARFVSEYQRNGQRSSWELGNLVDMTDSVYSNRFALRADANQRTLNHIPVRDITELREPGIYFAVMRAAGRFDESYDTALFFVSDIGLHARLHDGGSFVHAASLAAGGAVPGVQLSLLDRHGKTVTEIETDRAGNATLGVKPAREHLLVARKGDDMSLLSFRQPALDLSAFDIGGRAGTGERDAFLWGGRDLFRPGETIRVNGLLRDFDGRAVDSAPLFLKLAQPDGRIYLRTQVQPDDLGFFSLERTLPETVPTGRWKLTVAVEPEGKAISEFSLRIEDFLPERLKLELTSTTEYLQPGQALPLRVEAAYLYGAPAAGNRFLAELSFEHAGAMVESLKGFRFGDPTRSLPRVDEPALDVRLDAEGRFTQDVTLPDGLAGDTPVAVFARGSVFESGGRAVSRTIKRVAWPAAQLVGVRPLFDADDGASADAPVAFEIVRSAADGSLVAGNVEVALMRDRRDYTWSHDPELGWRVEYTSNWETVGSRQTLALADSAPTKFESRVEWGDYRLDVTDTATGLVTRLPFHAGWVSDDANQGVSARPDRIRLALDKTGYRAGEQVTVTLTPPYPGPGLLLVEAGGRLLESRDIDVSTGSTVKLTVQPDWERHDVHLTAIVFRPGSARDAITPNRSIGIVHLPIERGDRRIEVELQANERARPGDELVVTLNAPALAGQQAAATVSAVDQGIINITRYALPDAAGHFFAPRRYGIDAWDVYGRVIEYFAGHTARLRYGGDMALAALPQARRPTAKVATVDLFSGPVQLDAQGKATVRLTLPDFNGQLRLSTVVWSAERYGNAEAAVQVRAALVAEASSPRVMAPGDRAQLSLDLHNLSGQAQQLRVQVDSTGPLQVENGDQVVAVANQQRQVLSLPLIARAGEDVAGIRVRVTGTGIALERRYEMVVRPGWAPARASRLRELTSTEAITPSTDLVADFLPGSTVLGVNLSRQPPVPFASAIEGLIGYPYGCLEQTTSRAFPLALLDDDTARKLGIPAISGDRRRSALDDALARISAMQLNNGHFSFWGGESHAQSQMTPYVVEMMIEARDHGQTIPVAVLDKALDRLNEDLLAGGDRYYAYDNSEALRFSVRAHAGYVLARQGRAPLGTLRAMQDHEIGNARSLLSLVHLGLALHLQGDAPRARQVLTRAFENPPQRPSYLGDYGSELRDRALSLALLRQHGVDAPGSSDSLLTLARSLAGGDQARRYFSTQEQVALFRLGRELRRTGGEPLSGQLLLAGESQAIAPTALYSRQFNAAELAQGPRIQLDGNGPLFVVEEAVGVPRTAPAAVESGLSIRRDWFTSDGKPFRGDSLKEGESLIVRLTVQAQQSLDDLLVVDYLPGGLEAENLNLTDSRLLESITIGDTTLSSRYGTEIRHEEYRDDRYVAALRVWGGQTAELWYIARAVSPGVFNVPPPQAEDMYRAELRAVGSSRVPRITVTPP